ncbi:hypothetical protein ACQP2K_41885 [Microbispora siamensis]
MSASASRSDHASRHSGGVPPLVHEQPIVSTSSDSHNGGTNTSSSSIQATSQAVSPNASHHQNRAYDCR